MKKSKLSSFRKVATAVRQAPKKVQDWRIGKIREAIAKLEQPLGKERINILIEKADARPAELTTAEHNKRLREYFQQLSKIAGINVSSLSGKERTQLLQHITREIEGAQIELLHANNNTRHEEIQRELGGLRKIRGKLTGIDKF